MASFCEEQIIQTVFKSILKINSRASKMKGTKNSFKKNQLKCELKNSSLIEVYRLIYSKNLNYHSTKNISLQIYIAKILIPFIHV